MFIISNVRNPGQTGEIVTYEINGEEITCELINGEIVFQGDIILTEEQLAASKLKGASGALAATLWPEDKVPDVADDKHFFSAINVCFSAFSETIL